jgi:hypothetical protein
MAEALEARSPDANIHELMGSRGRYDIMERGKAAMATEVIRRMRLYNPGIPA